MTHRTTSSGFKQPTERPVNSALRRELQYMRCHCGRFVSKIVRVTSAEYGPFNPWYGWNFRDFGTCKAHGEVEIIADGDIFAEAQEL